MRTREHPIGRESEAAKRAGFVLALLIAATGLVQGVSAGGIRHDRTDSAYVALGNEPQFDSVGLIRPRNGGGGSGVLIASRWVLTAAHVVLPHPAGDLEVDFGGVRYAVTASIVHPRADIALLKLVHPVEGIVPALRHHGAGEADRRAVSVGFGMSGRGDESWREIVSNAARTVGTKRGGENVIEEIVDEEILQVDFDHPDDFRYNSFGSPEPLDLEYFPMVGDSGGGLFCLVDDAWVLIGITIAGVTGPLWSESGDWQDAIAYGWISQWQRVSSLNDWIDGHVR